jgi:hypothetical protein
LRQNVIAVHQAGLNNAAIAHSTTALASALCKSTFSGTEKTHSGGVLEPLSLLGGTLMLSQIAANGLWVLKCALPTLSYVAGAEESGK